MHQFVFMIFMQRKENTEFSDYLEQVLLLFALKPISQLLPTIREIPLGLNKNDFIGL